MKATSTSSVLICLLGTHLAQGFLIPTFDIPMFSKMDRAVSAYHSRTYPEEYILNLEVPGISPEELSISYKNSQLIVEGEHQCGTEEEARGCLPKRVGQVFILPRDINPDSIESTLENGVLTIRSARHQAPVRKVVIKAGHPKADNPS
ncbi:HSP20-like chaperone [Basidiobolus meristosporus CBS 931.73]|uniref:HSP20-like chaperone n=1 Tax=Basidiobolus meristosporus CBS 931.73 TaxID=1314790 RepID=A0A1Y1XH38_9FUNG|nr:HSP20-like chaperone [Basidiobolus meristosporus CBS 931.73]|eukprot:ORX85045.1 HSP20-like chaperone [Basidiobolus meristosporus CBS 931.73]